MVSELSMGLSVMKHEQEYMEVRERLHRMSKCACLVKNIYSGLTAFSCFVQLMIIPIHVWCGGQYLNLSCLLS